MPAPRDHLRKMARRESVPIYMDEGPAVAWEDAKTRLTDRAREVEKSRPARLAVAREQHRQEHPDGDHGTGSRCLQAAEDAVYAADERELTELRDAEAAARAAAEAVVQVYVFRSIGTTAWQDLRDKCPPTKADLAEWQRQGHKGQPAFDATKLAPLLVADASVDPVLSREETAAMFADPAWNDLELAMLFTTAQNAQTQARQPKRR